MIFRVMIVSKKIFSILPLLLFFCTSCNPYSSKQTPIGNVMYLKGPNVASSDLNVSDIQQEQPNVILPQDQPSFIDDTSNSQEVSDIATGKPVKIYQESKVKKVKSKKTKGSSKSKKKRTVESPYGNVRSKDLSNIAITRTRGQNYTQQNTKNNFIPLSKIPPKTYTRQQQNAILANKQYTQQAVSNRATQLNSSLPVPPQQAVQNTGSNQQAMQIQQKPMPQPTSSPEQTPAKPPQVQQIQPPAQSQTQNIPIQRPPQSNVPQSVAQNTNPSQTSTSQQVIQNLNLPQQIINSDSLQANTMTNELIGGARTTTETQQPAQSIQQPQQATVSTTTPTQPTITPPAQPTITTVQPTAIIPATTAPAQPTVPERAVSRPMPQIQ